MTEQAHITRPAAVTLDATARIGADAAQQRPERGDGVSLSPLAPEDALRALLATPPAERG